jgi:hypothetical protein
MKVGSVCVYIKTQELALEQHNPRETFEVRFRD